MPRMNGRRARTSVRAVTTSDYTRTAARGPTPPDLQVRVIILHPWKLELVKAYLVVRHALGQPPLPPDAWDLSPALQLTDPEQGTR